MKILKKAASLSIAAALFVQFNAFVPVPTVSAAGEETVIGDLTYLYVPNSPSNGECTILSIYDDEDKHVSQHDTVIIPESIGDYTVTAIGDDTQGVIISRKTDETPVTTIKLPNSIKEIHKRALVDADLPCLTDLYVNVNDLEEVGVDTFGLYTRLTEVYAYDKEDEVYYATSDDLDKFKELLGICDIRFTPMEGKDSCFMICKEDYENNKCVNGRLEFINEAACSPYTRKIGYLYAEEAIEKQGIKDTRLNNLEKMEKIVNFMRGNTRYSVLYPYNEDQSKCREMMNLSGSAMSTIGFHSGVCGGLAHGFEDLCRAAMGHEIVDEKQDVLCVGVPGHSLNAVRLDHNSETYYMVDNTNAGFLQGVGKSCVGEYGGKGSNFKYTGYIYGVFGSIAESDASNHDIYVTDDPNLFYDGYSYVYFRDETNGALHIEMGDKNDVKNNFIDFTSYPLTSPNLYLEQMPLTKCGEGQGDGGLNFYIEPNMYYGMKISNSKGEAEFSADGEHEFTLGDVKYVCSVNVRDYKTETPCGVIEPHNAYKNYFEVVIKQLTDDPEPETYTVTTVAHKLGTPAFVPTTTTTAVTTTTEATTTEAATTTTAETTTVTEPATTTTAEKETPNLIPPTGKELEYTGSLQELVNAGKASGGTVQYRIGEDGEWSDKIPTAAEIGNYTVYYRIVGNDQFFGSDENSDLKGRKNYTFPYCYDCQRSPAHPSKGDDVRAYKLKEPLVGDFVFDTKNKSEWTLEYVSAYKDFNVESKYLPGLVKRTQEAHSMSSPDEISIYELKDCGEHVTYCVIIAVSKDEKEVLFFGDTINGGGGYILSAEELSGDREFTVDKDTIDINVETIALAGSVNSKIFDSDAANYGDANCDGNIDMADVVLIMQSLASPNKYGQNGSEESHITEKGMKNADVDTTVKGITSNDALFIQEYLLQKRTSLVPEK